MDAVKVVCVLLEHCVGVYALFRHLLRCVHYMGVLVDAVLGDCPEADLFLRAVEVCVVLLDHRGGGLLGLEAVYLGLEVQKHTRIVLVPHLLEKEIVRRPIVPQKGDEPVHVGEGHRGVQAAILGELRRHAPRNDLLGGRAFRIRVKQNPLNGTR